MSDAQNKSNHGSEQETLVEYVELTKRQELVDFLKQNKYVLLKAGATWCKPCKRSTPIFLSHFTKLPKYVKLVVVDIDKGDDIAAFLKIRTVPHFAFYIEQECRHVCTKSKEQYIEEFYRKIGKDIMVYGGGESNEDVKF